MTPWNYTSALAKCVINSPKVDNHSGELNLGSWNCKADVLPPNQDTMNSFIQNKDQ